ncbi:MAG: hypothetical protein U0441_16350 [Polyangiaceae bacterium]
MRPFPRSLPALLATACILGAPVRAGAQVPSGPVTDAELDRPLVEPPKEPSEISKQRAKELFNQGLELASKGKPREALRAFRKAYEQHATPDAMANLAALELQLGKPRAAAEHLTVAIDHMLVTSDELDDLLARLAEAKKRIGTVELEVRPSSADVQWDAQWLGTGPMRRPLFVEPGSEHMLIVRYGGVEVRRDVKLAKGESKTITLGADDFPGAVAPSAPSIKEEPRSTPKATGLSLPWLLGGSGAALGMAGVAAVGFGVMAVADGERSKIERDIQKFGGYCSPQPLVGFGDDCHARDQEARNQAIGLGIGIGGSVLAAAAIGVTLGMAFRTPPAKVAVTPGPGGVWITGEF